MKKLLLILFSFICINVFGATPVVFNTISIGYWNNPIWTSGIPGYSIFDEININHNVTASCPTLKINGPGSLYIKSGNTLTVIGDVEFSNGSIIVIEQGAFLVITGNLVNKNNSDQVTVNGGISVTGNFRNGNGGEIIGNGQLSVTGISSGVGATFGHITNDYPGPNTNFHEGSLPVEIIYFKDILHINGVELEWSTASETNNDYYTIERSNDGINYDKIGIVYGSGNSNSVLTYSFSDVNPLIGISYYRLKQTDYDGKFDYCGVVCIKRNETTQNISIYPNPAQDYLFIKNINFDGKEIVISVYNEIGTSTYRDTTSNELIRINISNFKKGVYYLKIENENFMKVISFIKN